ncbi:MAG TPA: dephospho-CoA kinase [Candidatus Udaeobacter sp.]|jgi:dephospho-CoA kinase|nr:dephospho-CoA kinase [Candidatus Udaeobacter sp.]
MPAIGITGGIATGKTAFCDCLREILPGAEFFNADKAARALVNVPEVRKEIRLTFGPGVFSDAGDLNREGLRTIVFADATKRRLLERILHPRIRRQWRAEATRHRNSPDFFIADIPLLYEAAGEDLCDTVVVVACSYKVQLARLAQRMSLKQAEAEQMIKSQMPLEEKIRRADHVVWNNSDRALLAEQAQFLMSLWQEQSWMKR